jgi:hypothetical protein
VLLTNDADEVEIDDYMDDDREISRGAHDPYFDESRGGEGSDSSEEFVFAIYLPLYVFLLFLLVQTWNESACGIQIKRCKIS